MSIDIHNLSVTYRRGLMGRGEPFRALQDVTLRVPNGSVMGIVGESGSGKSTLGRVILRLLRPSAGQVRINGRDPFAADDTGFRRNVQAVFQDSGASLNPRRSVGASIREGLDIHKIGTPKERDEKVAELLERVGLSAAYASRMPHTLSGGQRQRVNIARAVALEPKILVADEPVSALDTSVQTQVLELLADLRAKTGMTMIFISHDLSVVREICDHASIMHRGQLVETGEIDAIFDRPSHPVTQALMRDMPRIDLSLTDLPPLPFMKTQMTGMTYVS